MTPMHRFNTASETLFYKLLSLIMIEYLLFIRFYGRIAPGVD